MASRPTGHILTYLFAGFLLFMAGHAFFSEEDPPSLPDEAADGVLLVLSEGRSLASLSFYFAVRHDGTAFLETLTGVRETWRVPRDELEKAKQSLLERGFASMSANVGMPSRDSERACLSLNDGTTKRTVRAESAGEDALALWEAAAAIRAIFGLAEVRDRAWKRWLASSSRPTRDR
jgi:hypothetical protein